MMKHIFEKRIRLLNFAKAMIFNFKLSSIIWAIYLHRRWSETELTYSIYIERFSNIEVPNLKLNIQLSRGST